MARVDGDVARGARGVEPIRGSGKLLDLINDILELSALESGQLRLTQTRVDLAAVALNVVREAAGLVGARPVEVRIEGEREVYARGDPKRVRQMLTNLVGNAIKFTQRGEVVVVVGREDVIRASACAIRDGISSQERAVIFQEYKQTKEERTRRRGGVGVSDDPPPSCSHARRLDSGRERGRARFGLPGAPAGMARRAEASRESRGRRAHRASDWDPGRRLGTTALLVVTFAPRLLLLDPSVVEASGPLASGGASRRQSSSSPRDAHCVPPREAAAARVRWWWHAASGCGHTFTRWHAPAPRGARPRGDVRRWRGDARGPAPRRRTTSTRRWSWCC
jgi:hypothetical protein